MLSAGIVLLFGLQVSAQSDLLPENPNQTSSAPATTAAESETTPTTSAVIAPPPMQIDAPAPAVIAYKLPPGVDPPPPAIGMPSIDTFAPMPSGAAPGASTKALNTAKSLGRGINFGNMFEPPREGDWGLMFNNEFVDQAWNAGFTTVRLPVRWSNHTGRKPPFLIDATFIERVESVVDKLLAKGFYVMLNMHHYRQLDGDALDPNEMPLDPTAVEVRYLMMWQQLAERFKDRSDRLLFELYNEPHGLMNGEPWNVLAARGLGVVRQSNPERIVVIGPTSWNSATHLALLKVPNDPNLIITIHNYEPFDFTHQGAEWVQPVKPIGVTCCSPEQIKKIEAPLDIAAEWSKANKYPIYLGEFGAYRNADEASRITFNRLTRDAAEKRGITWAYWEFASSFGVYDPQAKTFRQALLDSLMAK